MQPKKVATDALTHPYALNPKPTLMRPGARRDHLDQDPNHAHQLPPVGATSINNAALQRTARGLAKDGPLTVYQKVVQIAVRGLA